MFPPLLVLLLVSASAASHVLQPWGGPESMSKAPPSRKTIAHAAHAAKAGRQLRGFGTGFGSLPPREPPLVLPMRFADNTIAAAAALRPLGRPVVEHEEPKAPVDEEPPDDDFALPALLPDMPAAPAASVPAASVPPLDLTRKVQALLVLLIFAFALITHMLPMEVAQGPTVARPEPGLLWHPAEGDVAVHCSLLPEDEPTPSSIEAEQGHPTDQFDSDIVAKAKKGYSRTRA
eukprot:gnl/TRDRNA2_/TRDRNA2_184793_c0_seq1.p2 gnl/TRDRNA2_/TRDRNA2_184793_c0~~gnl/TRDRNA2_/TRDRNA2_184793_c0_seq1.p2  ORF type:complete len:233 (+),score=54.36 gnl/TRDRNA2_/TRDRNA2_184793_c0_seq1:63-761(+)